MASFLSIEEVAERLGKTVAEVNELREQGSIRAFRDGAGWKFKDDEVDRFVSEVGQASDAPLDLGDDLDLDAGLDDLELDLEESPAESAEAGGGDELELELSDEPAELETAAEADGGDALDLGDDLGELDTGPDSILLSEQELGGSSGTASSTIIGRNGGGAGEDSDVQIADDADEQVELGSKEDSDLGLAGSSELTLDDASLGSDVELAGVGSSDVLGGDASENPPDPPSQSSGFEDLDELDLDLEGESSKILGESKSSPASDLGLGESDLALTPEGGGSSLLGGSDVGEGSGGSSLLGAVEADLEETGESSDAPLDLAADEDDELVLGEGSGSDITISGEDSGIGLAAPTDSGLSLDEEPLELGGSTVESLELGEDDDAVLLEEDVDTEAATQLKADDDFMLTPLDDAVGEETEDSGSQVIALDSESFDESADTMLGGGDPAGAAAMADELGGMGSATPLGSGAAAPLQPAAMSMPEAPYSVWNVLSLLLCFVFLSLAGMMMYDLIRNMWSWDQAYAANSSIMDQFIEMIGWPKK